MGNEGGPTVGQASLHRPTGTVIVCTFVPHHDGGPITGRAEHLLEPTVTDPQSDRSSWSGRTEEDLEAVLAEHGWRVVTRAQAAKALRAEGYRLQNKRSYGHALYDDQADETVWLITFEPWTVSAFVMRN
ncbi:hypothetical protein [Micromonospora sp. NPDC005652]|uniref:hypothetical protein n=1 Tax=Micromonospora sp. NPDC005652 TaxID=3157046 RepID=UPI0033E18A56